MAYMSQEKKAKIAAALKAIPELKGWKYSLKVCNHTSIQMTIRKAPVDLIDNLVNVMQQDPQRNGQHVEYVQRDRYHQVNEFYLDRQFSGKVLETFKKIAAALNTDNFDHSDIQSDYFHVGHYVHLHVGEWDQPFIYEA